MSTGFHDLQVWCEAKALAVGVYRTTATPKDPSLRDQMRRGDRLASPELEAMVCD